MSEPEYYDVKRGNSGLGRKTHASSHTWILGSSYYMLVLTWE